MKKILTILILFVLPLMSISYIHLNVNKTNFNEKSLLKQNNSQNNKFLQKNNQQTKYYFYKIFRDKNLISKLKEDLSLFIHNDSQGDYILENDANKVTSLDISESNIKHFYGLGIFKSLNDLNLNKNGQQIDINDLIQISWSLIKLNISENNIYNISTLSRFNSLKYFIANNVKIIDGFDWFLIPIYLPNLIELKLFGDDVKNFSWVVSLKMLTILDLGLNPITDFSPLIKLTNLSELNIMWNKNLIDISPLSKLLNLKSLVLSINKNLIDISFLKNLKNLVKLDLEWDNISDISALASLKNLMELDLSKNRIPNTDTSWAPIHNLPNNPKGSKAWDSEKVRNSQRK